MQGVAENEELTQFEFDTDTAKCHAEVAQKRNYISNEWANAKLRKEQTETGLMNVVYFAVPEKCVYCLQNSV